MASQFTKCPRVHSLPVKITAPRGETEAPWFLARGHQVGTKLHPKLSSLSYWEINECLLPFLVFPQARGKEIGCWGEGYSVVRQKEEGKFKQEGT